MSFLLFALAAAAQPPAVPPQVQTIKEGDAFVMRTLDGAKPIYTYDKDEPGKSNCSEGTATGDGMGGVWKLLPTTAAE